MSSISLESILTQLFQPYFYYSVILLTISAVCIKILLRHYHFLGRRAKSIIYLIPLIIPVVVMSFFHPEVTARMVSSVESTIKSNGDKFVLVTIFSTETLSITGILCLIGLTLGTAFFITVIFFGDKIAIKLFHIIMLTPDEYPWLQKRVIEIAKKFNLSTPKIGIVEDLRPNAFTIGYGRRAILVFSIGLLDILNEEEVIAVASHELAHLKNHDFFFKTLSNALNIISFFNPFAYITASAAQREREMLADESGAKLLKHPELLAKALAKIHKVLQTFPKESLLARLTSSLFLVSPIARKSKIFATHPQVNQRVKNIAKLTSKNSLVHRNAAVAVTLSLLIIFGGITASYYLINIQTSFIQKDSPIISLHQPTDNFMLNPKNGNILLSIPTHALKYVTSPTHKCIHVKATTGTIMLSLQTELENLEAKYESIDGNRLINISNSEIGAFCLENSASAPLPYSSTRPQSRPIYGFRIGFEPFRVLVLDFHLKKMESLLVQDRHGRHSLNTRGYTAVEAVNTIERYGWFRQAFYFNVIVFTLVNLRAYINFSLSTSFLAVLGLSTTWIALYTYWTLVRRRAFINWKEHRNKTGLSKITQKFYHKARRTIGAPTAIFGFYQ